MTDRKSSYTYDDLIACANRELFGPKAPRLPMPPMLMMDRVVEISDNGGEHGKGHLHAEFDITPERWFFDCHFKGDPIMPGCLGLDGLWQLTGFWMGWMGCEGRGAALGVGEVKLTDMVTPEAKLVSYHIDFKRVVMRKLNMAVADGIVKVDGKIAYECKDLKVGVFGEE